MNNSDLSRWEDKSEVRSRSVSEKRDTTGLHVITRLYEIFGYKPDYKPDLSYAGIAYDWLVEPNSITLSFSTVTIKGWKVENSSKLEFKIEELPNEYKNSKREMIGTLGILNKVPLEYTETIHEIFEQNLADVIIKEIHKALNEVNTVVIQGPLFPKLVDWLGYSFIDGEKKNIVFITFHDYFQSGGNRHTELEDVWLKDHEMVEINLRKSNITKVDVHFDIFCQFPYKKKKIDDLFKLPGLVIANGKEVWLPLGLAVAWQNCSQRDLTLREIESLDEVLRWFEYDLSSPELKNLKPEEIVGIRTIVKLIESSYKQEPISSVYKKIEENLKAKLLEEGIKAVEDVARTPRDLIKLCREDLGLGSKVWPEFISWSL